MSPKGDEIARHVAQLLGSPVHFYGPGRGKAGEIVREAYAARAPIIGVCAAGLLIRLIGPELGDKISEPPVLAVSADGKIAVPLLGSHRGANALARWIADMMRGTAAITSFSDTLYDFSLNDLPPGYAVANPDLVQPVMAALLKGERLRVEGPSGWLELAGYPVAGDGELSVSVSETRHEGSCLAIHPRTLVAGIGCASGATADEVTGLVERTLAIRNFAPQSLAVLATLDTKKAHPALIAAADHFGVPLRVFTKREIEKERSKLATPSDAVDAAIGVAGVCEAVALKAGSLVVTKHASVAATCAIGKADTPIDSAKFGKPA
jgi:cobalamin biosynthesis protein CbiG